MVKRTAQLMLGSLALLGLFSVMSLWWTGMHQGDNHNCLSAAVQSTACPNTTTAQAVAYHMNTLKVFTTNVLQSLQNVGVLLVVLFLALAGTITIAPISFANLFRDAENRAVSPGRQRRRWLARLEHSPSVF